MTAQVHFLIFFHNRNLSLLTGVSVTLFSQLNAQMHEIQASLSHTRTRAVHRPHSSVHNNHRFLFSCTFLSVLCFIQRLFSVRRLVSAHVPAFLQRRFKNPFWFWQTNVFLQLLQTCVDSCLICTSTAVTLMLHGCGGSFRPTNAHHVTSFLPSTVRCWHLWLAHSLTFWIDLLRSTAHMHPHCWACRLAFFFLL